MMFDFKRAKKLIEQHFLGDNLILPRIDAKKELIQACGGIILYLNKTHNENLSHIKPIKIVNLDKFLIIDEVSERNLELFQTLDGKRGEGTLLCLLDKTKTPMGGRFLVNRLKYPLRNLKEINQDLDAVEYFVNNSKSLEDLVENLKEISDLERLINRIFLNRANPRDFFWLKNSLKKLPGILSVLSIDDTLPDRLKEIVSHWDNLDDLYNLLDNAIKDNPPHVITDGGIFKQGYNDELDELIEYAEHGESKLREL
ncbi:MAG: DNA mismatch repair protein MutS, partial [Bacteroidetes bacterium]